MKDNFTLWILGIIFILIFIIGTFFEVMYGTILILWLFESIFFFLMIFIIYLIAKRNKK